MTNKTSALEDFNLNIPLLTERRPHAAIELWNRKNTPICPGLGKRRNKRGFLVLEAISDSYGADIRD